MLVECLLHKPHHDLGYERGQSEFEWVIGLFVAEERGVKVSLCEGLFDRVMC